jgi:hypothetical protein
MHGALSSCSTVVVDPVTGVRHVPQTRRFRPARRSAADVGLTTTPPAGMAKTAAPDFAGDGGEHVLAR